MDEAAWQAWISALPPEAKARIAAAVAKPSEMRAYEPTFRDRLGSLIAGDSRPGDVRYNLAQGIAGSAGVGGMGVGLADFTPAGVPMAASDAAKAYDTGDYLGAGLSAAGAVLPAAKAGRAAMAAGDAAGGIKAYHGSPHDFDGPFSLDKIGTGEGAQAYGHGLYFAENEDVARSYRNALAPGMGDKALRAAGVGNSDLRSLRQFTQPGADPDIALRDWLGWTGKRETPEIRAAFMQDWSARNPGKVYEVNIKASPDEFLDWDKPVSQQSEKVKAALSTFNVPPTATGQEAYQRAALRKYAVQGPDGRYGPGGETMEESLAMVGGDKSKVRTIEDGTAPSRAKALQKAGIPGIRFLDEVSRTKGDGTRNLVVFDDSMIEILRKYGLLGPLGLGAGAVATGSNDGT